MTWRGEGKIYFSRAWKQRGDLISLLSHGWKEKSREQGTAGRQQNVKIAELRIERRGILIPRRVGKYVSHFFPFPLLSFLSPLLPRIFRRHKSRYYVARETNHYTADGLLRRKFDGSTGSQAR